jgi:pyrimidine-specific ribonucleoside hydrolase
MRMKSAWTWTLGCATALALVVTAWGHDVNTGPVENGERPMNVLLALPQDVVLYNAEAAALIHDGIPAKYGTEEWNAIVFTHEFHQHVGIYTLLGAKMAVRAREVLGAPMRAVKVISETTRQQPFACMVDGLQVGLGSTLGQNLITVPDAAAPAVAARFEYDGHRIRLSLKPEYVERLAKIIEDARQAHGDLTPKYFHAVEDASYEVWKDFDRREIFAIEKL